jgi:CHAT domain-containing protein/tetratricopeptide (TPR) repeat protein
MMGLRRVAGLAFGLAFGLAVAGASLQAQTQDDTDALDARVNALYAEGKYAEAIPLAERYVELMRARVGETHADYAAGLSNLAHALRNAGRPAEAEPVFAKAIAADEAALGPNHADLATDLRGFAELLADLSRLPEAEALYRRALAIDEANLGPDHVQVGDDLNELAHVLKTMSRLGEAEPLMRRSLAIAEARLGPTHAEVAIRLNNLGALLLAANRIAEAEPLMRRALAIDEANLGRNHATTAGRIGNLAQVLVARNALAEAEPLVREALAINEAQLGPDHNSVAVALANLAALLSKTGRHAEAEPLMRRALAIDEARFGPNHSRVAGHLNNLGQVLATVGRLAEAEPLMRRALAIEEANLGPDHPSVARNLNNLAQLVKALGRPAETEPMLRRALAIAEASSGPSHPDVAGYLNNLALLLKETGRQGEAEPLMRRVLAIYEEGLGPDHPNVATGLNNLALLLAERGDWPGALASIRRSSTIRTADVRRNSGGSPEAMRRLARDVGAEYKFHVLSIFETHDTGSDGLNESFVTAQRALASEAASALAEASARFAAGSGDLAAAVRESQDAARERASTDALLLAALAKPDKRAADAARADQSRLDVRLDAIAARLAKDFPEYAALASPEPLSVADVQALIRPDEAVVQFLNLPAFGAIPETGFVWAITKTDVRWSEIGNGTIGLMAWVSVLRCGLDSASWTNPARWPEATDIDRKRKADQAGRRERCLKLTGLKPREKDLPPFDLARSHQLYRSLFGDIEDVIAGKQLLIVPAGPLTGLPFQTLVTKEPPVAIPQTVSEYAGAAWLGRAHAITVLPSIASLQVLRKFARASKAPQPFLGFGNPLLTGPRGDDTSASAKRACVQMVASAPADTLARAAEPAATASAPRPGLANLDALRRQFPLPETADELCAVAASLGAPTSAVHLAQHATEAELKQLSAGGALRNARVLHFATHGLLAGETQRIAPSLAEPALLLTPPAEASQQDDGLLTASEVAQLQLDADWVVLSACNTAAASESGEEDLSGLARAFFYAGARALLVSHWYVDSAATVALITRTFDALRADPSIGRAEALRRAMTALIAQGRGMEHPAKWAPFVVVGEGGAPARAR